MNNKTIFSTKSYYDIFYFIVSKGKTTRREIEKETKYSWGTVSTQVCNLMDQGYIVETESFSKGLGRKTYFLTPNRKIAIIGVDLNAIGLSCTVAGLDGSELKCFLIPYYANKPQDVIDLIFNSFDRGFAWANENNLTVFSIGLSCQGGADNESGIFRHFYFVDGWEPVPIKQMLEEKYKKYVYISNDIGPLVGDYIRRFDFTKESTMIVRLVDGIGYGFTELDAYPSMNLVKSDFGHMIMKPNGAPCICGKKGCLEAYSSIRGIMMRAGLSLNDREELFIHSEKYQKYIDEAAELLAVGIINVISGFYVTKIVLTGRMVDFGEKFISKIQDTYNSLKGNIEPDINFTAIPNLSASLGIAIKSAEGKIYDEKL